MLAEVGVDSGGAAPASGWRSPSLPGPPDWATRANSHCTKVGARVQLWLGEGASQRGGSREPRGRGRARRARRCLVFSVGA